MVQLYTSVTEFFGNVVHLKVQYVNAPSSIIFVCLLYHIGSFGTAISDNT